MSRQILFCLLAVSWICLALGSNLVASEAKSILSSNTASFAHQARTVANPPTAITVMDCTGETDIILEYGETVQITICGTDFGAAIGDKDLEVVVAGGFKADIVDQDNTHLIVDLPTNGAGQHLSVRVTLGSWNFIVPNLWVSFPQPIVTDITHDTTTKKTRALVAEPVIIYGTNFGTPSPLIHVTASIGAFPCVRVHHVSNNEIRCTVTGYGANQAVIVTVNGQSSATAVALGGVTVRFDFMNTATPGLDCAPPFGAADVLSPEYCNCWSGSAPSDNLLSTDCSLHAVCAAHISTQPNIAQSAPSRPDTQFKDDKLWIKQTIPIVKNRRDTIIQFAVPALNIAEPTTPAGTVGSTQCNFPGTLWAKKLNQLDCLDEYYGVLPWSQHVLCGFVEHKDAAIVASPFRVFKSNMVTTYTETFKKSDGSIYFRKVSHSFLVSVSFTRQVVVLTHTPVTVWIADEKAPTSLDIVVQGDALYDVASKNTIIQFRTTIAWPYQIDDVVLAGEWHRTIAGPGVVHIQAVQTTDQPGNIVCEQIQDTTCEQSWIMTIDTQPGSDPQVCNLLGAIEFSTQALICRDYTVVGDCQGEPQTNFTIRVGRTDLCDDAPDVDASAGLNAVLETFYDQEWNVPQNIFQTGDMVFFRCTVTDPISTIDQITFKQIVVRSSSDASIDDDLYFLPVSGDPLSTGTLHTAAQANITQEVREPFIVPGSKGVLGFNFRLLRDVLDVVSTLSAISTDDITKQLTVEATIDILYHGNQKRTFVATSNVPALTHAQISFYDMGDDVEEMQPHNNDAANADDSNSLFASSAVSVVASVATVAVAVAAVAL